MNVKEYENTIAILQKHQDKRKDYQIDTLSHLIANDPFFSKQEDLKSYDIKEIANGLTFTKFKAGEFVFK